LNAAGSELLMTVVTTEHQERRGKSTDILLIINSLWGGEEG